MGQTQHKGGVHSPVTTKYTDYNPVENARQQIVHIPTMFRWIHGGRKVYIIGTFNGWTQKIPMNYNSEENSFIVILNVPVGKHEYRFIVDGEERSDPHQPRSPYNERNNYIEVYPVPELPAEDHDVSEDSALSVLGDGDTRSMPSTPTTTYAAPHAAIISTPQSGNKQQQQPPPPQNDLMSPNDSGSYSSHASSLDESMSSYTESSTSAKQQSMHQYIAAQQPRSPASPSGNRVAMGSPTRTQQQQPRQTLAPPQQEQQGHKRTLSTFSDDGAARDEYGQMEKVFVENKKAPPLLPPHLRYTPLNSSTKGNHDPSMLPTPLHVTVNHTYFAKSGNIVMTGITQRYRDKFSTVTFYKARSTKDEQQRIIADLVAQQPVFQELLQRPNARRSSLIAPTSPLAPTDSGVPSRTQEQYQQQPQQPQQQQQQQRRYSKSNNQSSQMQ